MQTKKQIDNLVVWFQLTQLNKSLLKKQDKIFPQLFYKKDRYAQAHRVMDDFQKNPHQISKVAFIDCCHSFNILLRRLVDIFSPAHTRKSAAKGDHPDSFEVLAHFQRLLLLALWEGILGVFQVGDSAPIRELPTCPLVDAPTPPHKPEATGPLRPY